MVRLYVYPCTWIYDSQLALVLALPVVLPVLRGARHVPTLLQYSGFDSLIHITIGVEADPLGSGSFVRIRIRFMTL